MDGTSGSSIGRSIRKQSTNITTERLGRLLGTPNNKGDKMIQHILTAGGSIIPIQILRSLTPYSMTNPTEVQNWKKSDYGFSQ